MALFTTTELREIERKHPEGINSAAVVKLFRQQGERFSEATLRKYVQLGLLPMSRRVGIAGRHRGSSGLYPIDVVRLINEIKRSLEAGATLETLRTGRVALAGELQALKRAVDRTLDRFSEASMIEEDKKKRAALRKDLDAHRKSLDGTIKALTKLTVDMGKGEA